MKMMKGTMVSMWHACIQTHAGQTEETELLWSATGVQATHLAGTHCITQGCVSGFTISVW